MFNDSPLIKTNYKIIKQLGEGSFGRVYLANSYQDKVIIYTKLIIVICSN
jgi:serine/threonine protein kinase